MIWVFWIIVGIALVAFGIFICCNNGYGEFIMGTGLAVIFIFITVALIQTGIEQDIAMNHTTLTQKVLYIDNLSKEEQVILKNAIIEYNIMLAEKKTDILLNKNHYFKPQFILDLQPITIIEEEK